MCAAKSNSGEGKMPKKIAAAANPSATIAISGAIAPESLSAEAQAALADVVRAWVDSGR